MMFYEGNCRASIPPASQKSCTIICDISIIIVVLASLPWSQGIDFLVYA